MLRAAGAPEGCRNDTLNRETWSLAHFVDDGRLPEHVVRKAMSEAAMAAGIPELKASRTIESALRSGGATR